MDYKPSVKAREQVLYQRHLGGGFTFTNVFDEDKTQTRRE